MSESDSSKKLEVSGTETNVSCNNEDENSVVSDIKAEICSNADDTELLDEIRDPCVNKVAADNLNACKTEDVADADDNKPSELEAERNKSSADSNSFEDIEMKDAASDEECDIIKMTLEGVEDDPDEPTVCMTAEEIQSYLLEKIKECMKDPAVNPILALKLDAINLENSVKQKTEELKNLRKLYERIFKDQECFLRFIGVMPKISTNDVGVGVDWPLLPSMIPKISRDFAAQGSSSPSSSTSSTSRDKIPVPRPPQGRPIECIDLTDD